MVLGNLISIIVVLVVVGLCLYLLETYIPLAEPIKLIICNSWIPFLYKPL